MCESLTIARICDGEYFWQWYRLEIRLNAFRRSTIPQLSLLSTSSSDVSLPYFSSRPKSQTAEYSCNFQIGCKVMIMMNCFCGMVDRRKDYLIFSLDHCQRSSTLRISDTPQARYEPVHNLSSCCVEWSCAVVKQLHYHATNLDFAKASRPDCIQVVVWKNCNRKFLSIPA